MNADGFLEDQEILGQVISISSDEDDMSVDSDEEAEEEEEVEANEDRRKETITGLEDITLSVMSQLVYGLTPSLSENDDVAENAVKRKPRIFLEVANRKAEGPDVRILQFPKKSKAPSITPLNQFLRVVEIAHEALVTTTPLTKRDVYYKDVSLFKSQTVVNGLVDDLAATLHVNRCDLNIRASAKGLFCGSSLTIWLKSGVKIVGNDFEPSLIPVGEDILKFVLRIISWVLIVEKDAVFKTICGAGFASNPGLPGPGIIITGKGYPDLAARQLVKELSDNLPPTVPIVALADDDPYGIDIVSVYKFGSASMRHQAEGLAARRVKWIGVSAADIIKAGIDRDALLPITIHDRKKALSMLTAPNSNLPAAWRRELMHMLHLRRKAEIEVLANAPPTVFVVPSAQNEDDEDESAPAPAPPNPLVRYLIIKINEICTTLRAAYEDPLSDSDGSAMETDDDADS